MPETVRKLDTRRRAVFPDCFSPGDSFLEEQVSDDCVVFRLIKRRSAPLVGLKEIAGSSFIEVSAQAQAPIDRKSIARAIREERDAR